jgi:hypothetical protein
MISIEEVGLLQPLIINQNNQIFSGPPKIRVCEKTWLGGGRCGD